MMGEVRGNQIKPEGFESPAKKYLYDDYVYNEDLACRALLVMVHLQVYDIQRSCKEWKMCVRCRM